MRHLLVLLVLVTVVTSQGDKPVDVTTTTQCPYSKAKESPTTKEPPQAKRDVTYTVEECGKIGIKQGEAMCARSEQLHKTGHTLKRGTPEFNHFQNMYGGANMEQYHQSLAVLEATQAYKFSKGYSMDKTPNTFTDYLLNQGYVPGPYKTCAPPVQCYSEKYRSLDGACNNKKYLRWGQAKTAFNRLMPPSYSDGVHAPRKSVNGYYLPYARQVSATLFDNKFVQDYLWTVLFMQFGQFISHDMSKAPSVHYGGDGIQCCTPDGSSVLPDNMLHHACYPIVIPKEDPFFWKFNQGCMNFVRTMTVAHPDCRLGPAEQMNGVTHWIDASQVYGSSIAENQALRMYKSGLLDYQIRGGKVVPPSTSGEEGWECDSECPYNACYKAGDVRVNQNLGLASLHILWLRFHNWLASELYKINPHWDDETLFQESRRILIAVYQNFVYNEYLPILLGWDFCVEHNIISHEGQYGGPSGYNDYVSPNILNEHATCAFRYQHSTIHGHSELIDDYRMVNGSTRLSDHFNCPAVLEDTPYLFNYYVNGMVTTPMQKTDQFFTHEITWFLFRSGKPFGLDLESIDIQRGRDHGLKPYNEYRVLCGLPRAYSFNDLLDVMSEETVSKLASLYKNVDDLDMMVAFLERHVKDAQFGPTLRCVTGEQFYRSRVADRFFFEHQGMPHSFSDRQLDTIHHFKMSKFICQNADYMAQMQPDAFGQLSKENHLVDCNAFPGLDLLAWQQQPY